MYWKCKTGKLGVQQLALACAVESLFRKQSMDCVIVWLDPMTFELKNNIPETVAKRLLADNVSKVMSDYIGEIKDGKLVVSKQASESDSE